MLDAGFRLDEFCKSERLIQGVGDRLLAINVLAGLDGAADEIGAHLRGAGIEKDLVLRILQRGFEIAGVALDAVFAREGGHLFGIAADEDRVRHHAVAVREQHAALLADRHDGADEVLVQPHASGDAVHDDAKRTCGHTLLPIFFLLRRPTRQP